MDSTKTVVEFPLEEYKDLQSTTKQILSALENLKLVKQPDYLSRKEFMKACKIDKNKFARLQNSGKLKYRKVGKMVYVPYEEVRRYFNNELE